MYHLTLWLQCQARYGVRAPHNADRSPRYTCIIIMESCFDFNVFVYLPDDGCNLLIHNEVKVWTHTYTSFLVFSLLPLMAVTPPLEGLVRKTTVCNEKLWFVCITMAFFCIRFMCQKVLFVYLSFYLRFTITSFFVQSKMIQIIISFDALIYMIDSISQ